MNLVCMFPNCPNKHFTTVEKRGTDPIQHMAARVERLQASVKRVVRQFIDDGGYVVPRTFPRLKSQVRAPWCWQYDCCRCHNKHSVCRLKQIVNSPTSHCSPLIFISGPLWLSVCSWMVPRHFDGIPVCDLGYLILQKILVSYPVDHKISIWVKSKTQYKQTNLFRFYIDISQVKQPNTFINELFWVVIRFCQMKEVAAGSQKKRRN